MDGVEFGLGLGCESGQDVDDLEFKLESAGQVRRGREHFSIDTKDA